MGNYRVVLSVPVICLMTLRWQPWRDDFNILSLNSFLLIWEPIRLTHACHLFRNSVSFYPKKRKKWNVPSFVDCHTLSKRYVYHWIILVSSFFLHDTDIGHPNRDKSKILTSHIEIHLKNDDFTHLLSIFHNSSTGIDCPSSNLA